MMRNGTVFKLGECMFRLFRLFQLEHLEWRIRGNEIVPTVAMSRRSNMMWRNVPVVTLTELATN